MVIEFSAPAGGDGHGNCIRCKDPQIADAMDTGEEILVIDKSCSFLNGAWQHTECRGGGPLTFVLPTLNRSGGSRVTVEFGNHLIDRGWKVRIAVRRRRLHASKAVKKLFRTACLCLSRCDFRHWGRDFKGPIEFFDVLDALCFAPRELVVAMGTYAVSDVRSMKKDVLKVRYCHGFAIDTPSLTSQVWSGSMPTLSVAHTLVPTLSRLGGPVIGVVPTGVCGQTYFDMGLPRDGAGLMYALHYNKAPDCARRVAKAIQAITPKVPLHVFGEPMRPRWLRPVNYTQYPTVSRARELYNRSLVWIVVSRMEGLPGSVLEAMACGCAVISTDNVGSRELIRHGENGILVKFGQTHGFVTSVKELCVNHELRNRLASNGKAQAAVFTWERAARSLEEALLSVRMNGRRFYTSGSTKHRHLQPCAENYETV